MSFSATSIFPEIIILTKIEKDKNHVISFRSAIETLIAMSYFSKEIQKLKTETYTYQREMV